MPMRQRFLTDMSKRQTKLTIAKFNFKALLQITISDLGQPSKHS
jgi:hypothetical protein